MEEKSVEFEAVIRRLSSMKYAQLRKAAKRHSVNANQKKEVLVTELSKIWGRSSHDFDKENLTPKELPEPTADEVTMSQSPDSPENDTLNSTFTIERGTQNGDMSAKACLVELTSTGEESMNRSASPQKSKSPTRGALTARFVALHQKLTEQQPTLHEVDANVKQKFAKHEQEVPSIFKRLATPKASKMAVPKILAKPIAAGYNFKNINADPAKMNFSFSRMYGTTNASVTVPNSSSSATPMQSRIPRARRVPGVGAKELTKKACVKQVRRSPRLIQLAKAKHVTVPQMTTRLRRLATPKGKNPDVSLTESEKEMVHRSGRRYKPRCNRLMPYVDTTKMTDRQFLEAKKMGKIQTLTAVSASKTEMRQEVNQKRQEARERVLRAKRGC